MLIALFSFYLSLLLHGAAIPVVYVVTHRPATASHSEAGNVIEIVLAPGESEAKVAETPPASNFQPTSLAAIAVVPRVAPASPQFQEPIADNANASTTTISELPKTVQQSQRFATPATEAEVVRFAVTDPEANPLSSGVTTGSIRADCLDNPKPAYPVQARRRKQEGLVILIVMVSADGRPESVEVVQSSGHALLDKAARHAVKRWRFTPAQIGNLRVATRVEVPIRFKLSEKVPQTGRVP